MKQIVIKYNTSANLNNLTALVESEIYEEMFKYGTLKQRCEYARWLISNSGWFTCGNIPKEFIISFEIEGIKLLELGSPKWKDGVDLDLISD